MINREDTALIIVDMQNDFAVPSGSMYVQGGSTLITPIVEFMKKFDVVAVTQDWHPANHSSFHNPWPVHCVQGTWGADLYDPRLADAATVIVRKGMDPQIDSYSAFMENPDSRGHRRNTGLMGFLLERRIRQAYYVGLARDYCVKWSAIDGALALKSHFVWDLTKAVDPDNDPKTFEELDIHGVKVVYADQVG